MMSDLIPSFRDSVLSPLGDPAKDILEMGIDMIFESETLKSIPIVNTVVSLCKNGVNLHERNLLRQTAVFINEVRDGSISPEIVEQHREELEHNPEKAEKELGRVMIILGKQIDELQSRILGSFYKAYIKNAISWEKFCELAEANSRMFVGDYSILKEASNSGIKINQRELYQIDRLISLGLLENQLRTGPIDGSNFSIQDSILVYEDTRDHNISLTPFGITFCQLMPYGADLPR